MTWLAENCPRLHAAQAAQLRIAAMRAVREARLRDRVASLEWLVAHRELQLLRAGARNDGRYVKRRADKLERARGDLARVRADLAAVGRWEPEREAAA